MTHWIQCVGEAETAAPVLRQRQGKRKKHKRQRQGKIGQIQKTKTRKTKENKRQGQNIKPKHSES